jgi:hypothetical protein
VAPISKHQCTDIVFCNMFDVLHRMLLQQKETNLKIIF